MALSVAFVLRRSGAQHLVGDPEWRLLQQVIRGYGTPGANATLDAAIDLGTQLAAFWGDRLRRQDPSRGPQLVPSRSNSQRIMVRRGTRSVNVATNSLNTKLVSFDLASNVKRVEFEFEPGVQYGIFWGLVKPNEPQEFRQDGFVSFCVGGEDEDDEEWPGHFPVTFTHGSRASGSIWNINGRITVNAETGGEKCTNPSLHWACRVMLQAGSRAIFGPGIWSLGTNEAFGLGGPPNRPDTACTYRGDDDGRLALLYLGRHHRIRQARASVRNMLRIGDDTRNYCRQIDAGDIAAICDRDHLPSLLMAEGMDTALIFWGRPDITSSQVIRFARGIAHALD